MSFSWTRVGAILHKELRDYRRNRSVIGTMAATPVLFRSSHSSVEPLRWVEQTR